MCTHQDLNVRQKLKGFKIITIKVQSIYSVVLFSGVLRWSEAPGGIDTTPWEAGSLAGSRVSALAGAGIPLSTWQKLGTPCPENKKRKHKRPCAV